MAGAHLQYVSFIFAKFQIDSSKSVKEVDYTNLTSCIGHFSKKGGASKVFFLPTSKMFCFQLVISLVSAILNQKWICSVSAIYGIIVL